MAATVAEEEVPTAGTGAAMEEAVVRATLTPAAAAVAMVAVATVCC